MVAREVASGPLVPRLGARVVVGLGTLVMQHQGAARALRAAPHVPGGVAGDARRFFGIVGGLPGDAVAGDGREDPGGATVATGSPTRIEE